MGRRKLEIKRIEDKSARQVTFSKRRNGLLKKAKELSVLCDVEIAALIFSNRGKLYHFCRSSNSLPGILERYNSSVEEEAGPSSTGASETQQQQEQHSKYEGYLPYQELLQIVEREFEDPGKDELSVNDLQHLENQLEAALLRARSTKTHLLLDSISGLQEKGKMVAEENRLLEEKVAGKKKSSSSSPGGGQKKIILDLNVLVDMGGNKIEDGHLPP